VEKHWPFDIQWSEEYALEFLLLNDVHIDKTKRLIQYRDRMFYEFYNSKQILTLDKILLNNSKSLKQKDSSKKNIS
jgi:hypothetical protein